MISTDAELRSFYDGLRSTASSDASADDGGREYPAVDFARERVIVREGPETEAVFWAVAQGELGVVGLLSCGGVQSTSCVVNVIAVPALITRVETRKCDSVGCGPPQQAPVRVH